MEQVEEKMGLAEASRAAGGRGEERRGTSKSEKEQMAEKGLWRKDASNKKRKKYIAPE